MSFEFQENQTVEQKTETLKNEVLKKLDNIEERERIIEAVNLALDLHSDQRPRPDGPYVDHILRGVNRLLDLGIIDANILIASALHDSVEDQASKLSGSSDSELSERNRALESIKARYGQRTASIVNAVTNPEELSSLKGDELNEKYAEHLRGAIESPDVLYVKLSDFLDNGLKIKDIADLRWQSKLAKKYLPIYRIFIDRIRREDIVLPEEARKLIVRDLAEAEAIASDIANIN